MLRVAAVTCVGRMSEEIKTADAPAATSHGEEKTAGATTRTSSRSSMIVAPTAAPLQPLIDATMMYAVYMEGFGATKEKVKVGARPRPHHGSTQLEQCDVGVARR